MSKATTKKILIVEDDLNFQDILRTCLGVDLAFSTILAKDGEEGTDLVIKEKPDLILSDILMPKMDGVDMAKKIRESGVMTPIIFLTNVSDASGVDRAFSISNSRYIVKSSIHIEEIIKIIKDTLTA